MARQKRSFRLAILMPLILGLLFFGNAGNNFLRYTDLYKFFRPQWAKQFIFIWEEGFYPDKWEWSTKRQADS